MGRDRGPRRWPGRSTAVTHSDEVLAVAFVVKLARVLLLGPLILPFILLLLLAVTIRSARALPNDLIDGTRVLEYLVVTGVLFALGTRVRVARLRSVGARALLVDVLAGIVVADVAFAGVLLLAAVDWRSAAGGPACAGPREPCC